MSDWVLPLRAGDYNEEARFAIRSWVANAGMSQTDRLVVIGSTLPDWIKPDVFLPGNLHRAGNVNVYANIRDACLSGFLGEQALIVNDDFFAMEPVDPAKIWHRGPLSEHIAKLTPSTWWGVSMRLTMAYLRSHGIAHPLTYELHRPLLVDTAAMGAALNDAWRGHGVPPQWRTIYGNVQMIGGEQTVDGKILRRKDLPEIPWWSTSDSSFRQHLAGEIIRSTFTTRTRWEV